MTIVYSILSNKQFRKKNPINISVPSLVFFANSYSNAIGVNGMIGYVVFDDKNNNILEVRCDNQKVKSKLIRMALEKAEYFTLPGPFIDTIRSDVPFYERSGFVVMEELESGKLKMSFSPLLRSIKRFCRNPSYHRWRVLSPEIKKQLVTFSEYCIKSYKGKTIMADSILKYSKIPTGNVFKVFERSVAEKEGVFDDKLYFPKDDKDVVSYNKIDDKTVFGWLNGYTEAVFESYLNKRAFLGLSITGYNEYIKKLKVYVINCSRELFYDKIRSNYNFVTMRLLKMMIKACLIVSVKLIWQMDLISYEHTLIEFLSEFNVEGVKKKDGECYWERYSLYSEKETVENKNIIKKMMMDLLITTNYHGCHEVRRRLNDAKNPGENKRDDIADTIDTIDITDTIAITDDIYIYNRERRRLQRERDMK